MRLTEFSTWSGVSSVVRIRSLDTGMKTLPPVFGEVEKIVSTLNYRKLDESRSMFFP